jgi:SET domain-containing protein
MLLVRTYLDKSSIHGIGLFATEDIKAGTQIYYLDHNLVKKFPEMYVNTSDKVEKEFFNTYAWKKDNYYYLSLDNDRFMNHSEYPNTYETEYATFAKVDIMAGEEITCNYKDFCQNSNEILNRTL